MDSHSIRGFTERFKETENADIVFSIEFLWFHLSRHLLLPTRDLAGVTFGVRFSTNRETILAEV